MAIVYVKGVGKVDNVTQKVVEPEVKATNQAIKPAVTPTTVTPTIPTAPKVGTTYANDNYGYINKLSDAQAVASYNKFKSAYDTTIGNINKEAATIDPTYQAEKQKATSQSELQKLNFAQYLQSRGVGSGGQMQSELSRQSALGNTLGVLQTNKQKALEGITTRKTEAANTFNTGWADYQAKSNIDKMNAVQAQKQAEAEAVARAKETAAREARADARAAANRANAAANAQIRANATISAAQIKAQNEANKAAAEARKPANVDANIKKQFNITINPNTGEMKVVKGKADYPGIAKVITTSGMTPAEQFNMMKKYGIVTDNGSKPLGKINLSRFVENVVNAGIDQRQAYSYLKKVGVNFNTPNYKTGKKQTPEQIIDNILKGLMPSGAKYAK